MYTTSPSRHAAAWPHTRQEVVVQVYLTGSKRCRGVYVEDMPLLTLSRRRDLARHCVRGALFERGRAGAGGDLQKTHMAMHVPTGCPAACDILGATSRLRRAGRPSCTALWADNMQLASDLPYVVSLASRLPVNA